MTVQPARAHAVPVHRPAIIRVMHGSTFRRVHAKVSKRLKAKARSRRSPVDRIGKAIEGLWIGALNDDAALHCLPVSLIAAAAVGRALIIWLRRGAPVSQQAAGCFTGIAAGAIGTLLYGFSCPVDSFTHLGIWHVVPVAVAAIAGRLIAPKLIAW